jgi:hypothetical protein
MKIQISKQSLGFLRLSEHLRNIRPYADKALIGIGWLIALFVFYHVAADWSRSLRTPLPHQYGEGIMTWMAREIDNARWPYGDILGTPSRYSCYAPLAPSIAAAVSRLVGGDEMRYVFSGRILTYACWMLAGLLISYACCRKKLPMFASSLMFLVAISNHSFFWTYRVDAVVIVIEASILALLSRASPSFIRKALPALMIALTMTKPPAVVDLLPIGIMAAALREGSLGDYLRLVWRPALIGAVVSPIVFFSLDAFSGFWMSNNILWEQMSSGSLDVEALVRNISRVLLDPAMWIIVLLAASAVSSNQPRARLTLVSIAVSMFFCVTFSTKAGADANYYFPLVVMLCATAFSQFKNNPNHATVALLAIMLVGLPFDKLPPHRNPASDEKSVYRAEALRRVHDQDNFITEDPFYSVLASRQPMVTDIFQFTIASANAKLPTGFITSKASGAWGGDRLSRMLARPSLVSVSEGAIPMGASYVPEAVWVSNIAQIRPAVPPQQAKWSSLGPSYYALAIIIPLLLIFWALLPFRMVFEGRECPPLSPAPRRGDNLGQNHQV